MSQNQFYCVSCRKRVKCDANDMCLDLLKNKKRGEVPALRCVCSCGTNLIKFVKLDDVEKLADKYGMC